MTQRKPILATRVSPVVNKSVKQLAETLGIAVSEYLRKLILDDLESKRMFDDQFRTTVEKSEAKQQEGSPEARIKKMFSEPPEVEDNEGFW